MKNLFTLLLLALPLWAFSQVDFPITFEDTASIDYMLEDFGGNASSIVVDPTDSTNFVAQAIRTAASETFAGTTMGRDGLSNPIPFSQLDRQISVRVWSPDAGVLIKLKAEDASNAAISVETDQTTTVAGDWETLTFNFTDQSPGTAGINTDNTYDKLSIFFSFGSAGADLGEKTYFWDDVTFVGGGGSDKMQVDLPVTFEDTASVNYALEDFAGNASSIVVDPTDSTNLVAQAIRTGGSETFAGTTIGGEGLASAIPFTQADRQISVRVWSPIAGALVKFKVEDASNAAISVETDQTTSVAGDWETLTFNFSNQSEGTAPINIGNTYNKATIFFNFGVSGADAGEQTYFFDDIIFVGGGGSDKMQIDLPITFEDTASVDYALADFGGNASSIVVDPTDANNLVGQAIRTAGSETFAGTTIGGNGLANPIGFSDMDRIMTVRVWSPDAGTIVKLKTEDASNAAISVETDAVTTVAGEWETLSFNFSNQSEGTAPINTANTYNKVSIFFAFGSPGAELGEKTYYWDDVIFAGGGGSDLMKPDLPITFEDTASVDYALTDFAGNVSMIVTDPTDETNLVGQAIRTAGSETFAGTTVGGSGLANAIPLTAESTVMSVRVWSPIADVPVRLKVENAGNPGISVETEDTARVAGEWNILNFDFANQAEGTAAFNPENVYDKVTIFFNFNAAGAEEATYYWDDIAFGFSSSVEQIPFANAGIKVAPNPANDFIRIELPKEIRSNVPLAIFDINGQLVKNYILANDVNSINVSDLNAGFYFFRIDNGNQQLVERIIIAK